MDRTMDEVIEVVTGLHDDNEEDRLYHQQEIEKVGKIVKAMEAILLKRDKEKANAKVIKQMMDALPESARLLMQFDDYLWEFTKAKAKKGQDPIRLRSTQKFAVLYSVESNRNVLEQVNTGEGKTYIIAAMAVIRAKLGYKCVDIITSSPVLAERDASDMQPLYAKFSLSVSHNCQEDLEERKKAYNCDIVYGDMARFQRDYLLHSFYNKNILGDRTQNAVIVDEVDNMLLDNGNNMLYLSHNVVGLSLLESLLIFIHKQINSPIYSGMKTDLEQLQAQFESKKIKQAVLADIFGRLTSEDAKQMASTEMTAKTIKESFEKLMQIGIIDEDGYLKILDLGENEKNLLAKNFQDKVFLARLEACLRIILGRQREIELPKCLRDFVKLHLDEWIENCKNAMFMGPDNEYVVDVDHARISGFLHPLITIIDSNTGADLATSQWSGGLHQFLQLKHGCRLAPISLKAVFISNVAYLKGYTKINGLSGTLGSIHESKTLQELYRADLIKIPTFKPKLFYEHVPVIVTSEEEWLQSLYEEVNDQMNIDRSVLIICESIAQLRTVHNGLKCRYLKDVEVGKHTQEMEDCFESITIYERQFQNFQFKNETKLECNRLIIATNLAGRGTDIKLCEELVEMGGLHVITAFLPANCRIEEQAYGRAARSGEPGSAQIIAMNTCEDYGRQPSIFQLKMFRDNKEVLRLASLKKFYDFHTETEEKCLGKFRHHCHEALSSIYSSKNSGVADETLPTPVQVMYFALLDKWAMWLDEKSPQIRKCVEMKDNEAEVQKESIIKSVDEFLAAHPIGNCDRSVASWIDFPQSLITLGIIQMCRDDGFESAESTFSRVLQEGHEFAAEVEYFRACMRMNNWIGTRKTSENSNTDRGNNKDFKMDIEYAIEHFYKSRALFVVRIKRHQKEGKLVAQFLDSAAPNHIKTKGFEEQMKAIATTYELIIANIDWMLGIPCKSDMFVHEKIDEAHGKEIYDSLLRQGVISPALISNHKLDKWQFDRLRHTFKLSKASINKLFDRIKTDPRCEVYDDFSVLDIRILASHVKLSNRAGFWMQLKKLGVFQALKEDGQEKKPIIFQNLKHVLIIEPEFQSSIPEIVMKNLKAIPEPSDEILRNQIRISNSTDHGIIFDFDQVDEIEDEKIREQVDALIENGVLKEDWIGQINRNILRQMGYLDEFDGVTSEEFVEYFEIDPVSAAWILDVLMENEILKKQTFLMRRLTTDDEIWKKKIGVYLNHKKENVNVLEKYAEFLDMIRRLPDLKNLPLELLKFFCKIESPEEVIEFYKLLQTENLLVDYKLTKFRLFGKIDCSCLPEAIAKEVDEFLSDRFAYSYALEHLCQSLDESIDNPRASKKIFLQENPSKQFYEEIMDLGVALPARILSEDQHHLEEEDYKHFDTMKKIINEHRLKLYDQTFFNMELVPLATYLQAQNRQMDADSKVFIENGLRMVMTKREAGVGFNLMCAVAEKVSNGVKSVWSGVKWIGNGFYSIGAGIAKWAAPYVQKCTDAFDAAVDWTIATAKSVKSEVSKMVEVIAETEIVKMATQTVKDVARAVAEVGEAVVEKAAHAAREMATVAKRVADETGVTTAVSAVAEVARQSVVQVGEFTKSAASAAAAKVGQATAAVGKFVVEVGTAISQTKVYQLAKKAFNASMDAVKYAYQKMSSYITAVAESYLYYNQCRSSARRLALEHKGMLDEHMLLRSYDDGMTEQNRQDIADKCFEKNMRDYLTKLVELWLVEVRKIVEEVLKSKFTQNQSISKNHLDILLPQNSSGLRQLKSDTSEHFLLLAGVAKVTFFQLIKQFTTDNERTQPNLATLPLTALPLGQVKCNFDRLKESVNILCDEIQETMIQMEISPVENGDTKLVQLLKQFLEEKLTSAVKGIFLDPTMDLITAFLAASRNRPQLATMASFGKEDTSIKRALADLNAATHSKMSAEFLKKELYKTVYEFLEKTPENKRLLCLAIKYGLPLPLATVKPLAIAIHHILEAKRNYGAGIVVSVFRENAHDQPILQFATKEGAKIRVELRYVRQMLFLCKADYLTYASLDEASKVADDINDASCIFEVFLKAAKFRSTFPKLQESFREYLLNELDF